MRQRYSKRDVDHNFASPGKISGTVSRRISPASLIAIVTIVFTAQFSPATLAALADREQAKFLHDRLTGTQASDAMLDLMHDEIASGNEEGAARLAIDGNLSQGAGYGAVITPSGGFYNAVVKNWASPWTNEEQDIFKPLNDYSATIIGMVRDGVDFSQILSADIIYVGNSSLLSGSPNWTPASNNHYEELEAMSADLGDPSVLQQRVQSSVTGIPSSGVAGIITTRQAARAYFIDGTNRAMFRFTVLNHLCNDLEQYKDTELPSDRIRQDVSRSPGGDSSIFLNECSGCHTGMDGMAGAFANYEYDYVTGVNPALPEETRKEMGRLVYTPGAVQAKYLINPGNFRDGHVTTDNHWVNYWRTGPNAQKIGWLRPLQTPVVDEAVDPLYQEGDGAAELGLELANTEAFASCQVKKAFESVCLREPQQADQTAFETIVDDFKTGGYDMKQAFIDVAVYCSSYLNP